MRLFQTIVLIKPAVLTPKAGVIDDKKANVSNTAEESDDG
jgi:hypothetical protein